MRAGIVFVTLVAAGGFVAVTAGPAAATSMVCVKSGSTLSITMPAGTRSAELFYAPNGSVGVDTTESSAYCIDQVDQSMVHTIELFEDPDGTPTAWSLRQTDWRPDIVIHDDETDTFAIHQAYWEDQPPPARIQAAASPAGAALSFDGDPSTPELLLDQPPTLSTFDLIKTTDDVVDLDVGAVTYPGDTVIRPGPGADLVQGGSGDDRVFVDEDGAADSIVGGGSGADELRVSTPDYHVGAVVDPTSPGGDGVAGEDDYGLFERVVGSDGPDRFVAPPQGMVALGGPGGDHFVAGPGDDTFYGVGASQVDWFGGDIMDLSGSPHGIVVTNAGSAHDTVTGYGTDTLIGVEGIIATEEPDTIDSGFADWVRPGTGDDVVTAHRPHTGIFAEPINDGMDTVDPNGYTIDWNYELRSSPLSLTLDGVANDGEPGEHDNITSAPGVTVYGGSSDDVIVGSRGPDGLAGNAGNDRIRGHGGRDGVAGGSGADRLEAGRGPDTVYGDTGDDVLVEGDTARANGQDELDGGAGDDVVTYAGRTRPVTVTVGDTYDDGEAGEDDYVHDVETVIGTSQGDELSGTSDGDVLEGGGGADVLRGKGGIDVLVGNGGDDRFYARDGLADTLRGGTGEDRATVDDVDILSSIDALF